LIPLKYRIKFNTEDWFSPFILEWLHRTDDKWNEWAENAVTTDEVIRIFEYHHFVYLVLCMYQFMPILAPTTMYSHSVRDIFSFFSNGLLFLSKLKTEVTTKRDQLTILLLKMMCKSLATYTEILSEEFAVMEETNNDAPVDFTFQVFIFSFF
jgi:hypothetical protein